MGTTNSLSLQKSLHLPPPLVSRGQTLGSLAECPRDYSSQPSLLPLPLFPHILALHSPSTRRTTIRNGSSLMLNCHSNILLDKTSLPDAKSSKLSPKRRGIWEPATCLPRRICLESTTTEGAPLAEGQSEDIGDSTKKKTTETESRSPLAIVYACTVPGWSIPGKIWIPTNHIRATSARARAFRELRARALQAFRGI